MLLESEARTGDEAEALSGGPEVPGCAVHLFDALFEIGPVLPGGMGPAPLTFGEISRWSEVTGVPLGPWEARTLVNLSRIYQSEYDRAAKGGPAPLPEQEVTADHKARVARGLGEMLRRKARKAKPKNG
jgi:hypothetical protein